VREADPGAPLGMNYSSLVPVLIKAIKEQQTQIKTQQTSIQQQQEQLKQQQTQIDSLRKMVCLDHPNAEFCR